MSQIYASYLARFLGDDDVHDALLALLKDNSLVDWQRMWILAALSQVGEADDAAVKVALGLLKDANRHEALRAVAAIYVGRFGDHRQALSSLNQTRRLKASYEPIKPIVQRVWGDQRRTETKRREIFENAVSVIVQACETGSQMEIPTANKAFAAVYPPASATLMLASATVATGSDL